MEDKNIALLGFVSSAADYLKKQIKDNSEEIKELDEIDLDKIKSELGNRLGSSFDGVQDKSNDLINAGREVFNDFINDSSKMIDEFNDIFNVDFKKENDEKDEEMVNHLISILREPSKFEEVNDFETQIARAANDSYIEDNKKIEIAGSDNEELDSLFSEIIANENIKVEEPVLNPFVDIETEFELGVKENTEEPELEPEIEEELEAEPEPEPELDNGLNPDEIKQLIRDTISEFFTNTNKPKEKDVSLDEVIDSFDVLKNVVSEEKNDELKEAQEEELAEFETLCSDLDKVEYEELNPNNNSLLDGVFKRVDEYEEINEEELAELEEDSIAVEERIEEATNEIRNDVDSIVYRFKKILPPIVDVIDEKWEKVSAPFVAEPRIEEPTIDIGNDIDSIVARLKKILPSITEVINEKWEKESKPFVAEERIEEATNDIGNDIDNIVDRFKKILPPIVDVIDEKWEKVSAPFVAEPRIEEPTIDIGNDIDSIVDRMKAIIPSTEPIVIEESEAQKDENLDEEFTCDDEISLFDDVPGMRSLSEIIESCNTLCPSEDVDDEPDVVENDYLEEYNNRSLEELYIPNPGLDILEQEEFDLGLDVEDDNSDDADFDLGSNDSDYVGDLFDEFTNNEYEVDDFKHKQDRINELNKKIYDSIVALYPYLSNGFIKGVYELKESFASDYKEGQKIIILHRLVFANLEGLRQFVDVMMSHEYFVNVDEKQMIVDTFKEHFNTDGKILTDIFEIANQAKLLTGEYDGYRIIEVDD